ncbi:MAG: ABC transporter permease subunit [Alphaproteobacteria bacterium]|nr:ABC transporter permease subunit [Alphaproteobacteria bacterium]
MSDQNSTQIPKKITKHAVLIWLGLRDNSFTRQKTVKFGDSSAINSGRFYSIITVVSLISLWTISSIFEWVQPFFWPPIDDVISRFMKLFTEGFRNIALWDHVSISVYRVLSGVLYGSLVGIPLGLAMGLSSVIRGMFDPVIEFMRPIPPLALIPLVILWFGIDETAKIYLLFLASLFIMVIAARSGVSSVSVSKVHAAYMLGATKTQVLRHVIIPNAMPEIFTGWRISMGVCWGTVVAAELVAADRGLGSMIMIAKNFLQTDTVVIGIVLIGLIGYSIELIMRALEKRFLPWKGKG